MTDVAIDDITPRIQYTADGATLEFAYPFVIFDDTDMQVYLDDTLQTSGYTVSGAGVEGGGSVTFSMEPTDGTVVTLARIVPEERTTDFQTGGAFRAEVINEELDRIVCMIQQISESIERSITRPTTSTSSASLDLPDPSAGKALKWNDAASALENSTVDPDDLGDAVTEAAASASAAATSETNAAASAASAASSAASISLPLPISSGGTGATTASAAASNLGLESIPVGTELMWPGTSAPTGFLAELGPLVLRSGESGYADLWAFAQASGMIVTDAEWTSDVSKQAMFSSGDGATNFRLPDKRALVDRGQDPTDADFGRRQEDAFQGHKHTAPANNTGSVTTTIFSSYNTTVEGFKLTTDGIVSDGVNGTPRVSDETRMKNAGRLPIIKY